MRAERRLLEKLKEHASAKNWGNFNNEVEEYVKEML